MGQNFLKLVPSYGINGILLHELVSKQPIPDSRHVTYTISYNNIVLSVIEIMLRKSNVILSFKEGRVQFHHAIHVEWDTFQHLLKLTSHQLFDVIKDVYIEEQANEILKHRDAAIIIATLKSITGIDVGYNYMRDHRFDLFWDKGVGREGNEVIDITFHHEFIHPELNVKILITSTGLIDIDYGGLGLRYTSTIIANNLFSLSDPSDVDNILASQVACICSFYLATID